MLILFYIVLERPICVNLMGDKRVLVKKKKDFAEIESTILNKINSFML